jgi:hypothetical protein
MKYRRRGVKREHSVIEGFAAVFERLAALPGVAGVIPGRIAQNPTRHPGLVLKGETTTGFKLLAKTRTSVQEVFVVARAGARTQVLEGLSPLLARPSSTGPSRTGGDTAGPHRRTPEVSAPRRPPVRKAWRNPGVLPAGPSGRPPVRASTGPAGWPGTLQVGQGVDAATRRRLLWLRLRRARWRRKFGVPRRTVPLPRRAG